MAICIPIAGGVPGSSGQPPYWLPGHPTFPQNDELDDPRWRGAYRRSLPVGGGQEAVFRALCDVEGSTKFLYLSWRAYVPDIDDADDVLWVGFRPTSGDSMVIRIKPHGDESAHKSDPVDAIAVFSGTGAGGTPWNGETEPTWIANNTRMWVEPGAGTEGYYTVQMRVPLAGTTILDNAGPNLGNEFGLWFFIRGGGGSSIIKVAESPDLGTTLLNLNQNRYPEASTWEAVSTQPGAAICPTTGGIDIEYLDIGTTNTPSSAIRFAPKTTPLGSRPVNTFFARPRNYTGSPIAASALTARFRIANWGSVAVGGTWEDIPGGGAVQNSATIPAHPPGSTPPPSTPEPISFDWRLDDDDIDNFTDKTPHQCMLVELNGPFTFFNESVYRNMDFVSASTFEREAEINIEGLQLIPGGGSTRDVYVSVEKINLPAVVKDPEKPPPPDIEIERRPRTGERERPREGGQGQPSAAEIEKTQPTVRYHVYYDTGERIVAGSVERPVLSPQTSFGYYVEHSGPLAGWQQTLQAEPSARLQQVGPDFHKLVVPNNGSVKVTTRIIALERPGCAGILIELIRRLLSRRSSSP